MKIIILGATGLIGKALVASLSKQHQLTLIGRDLNKLKKLFNNDFTLYTWDDIKQNGVKIFSANQVIINLAGENIGERRWRKKQKLILIKSRVETTELIAKHCAALGQSAPHFINASAVGIYGLSPSFEITYDEKTPLPTQPKDFASQLVNQWEQALRPALEQKVKITTLRLAVVLSGQGGALTKMLPAFKWHLGAILGKGEQPLPWVALPDVIEAICFLMHTPVTGPVNIVAGYTAQKLFAKTLARTLNRACFLKMPAWVVKLIWGQMATELLLNGQCVKSKRLTEAGFQFKYNELEKALLAATRKAF